MDAKLLCHLSQLLPACAAVVEVLYTVALVLCRHFSLTPRPATLPSPQRWGRGCRGLEHMGAVIFSRANISLGPLTFLFRCPLMITRGRFYP